MDSRGSRAARRRLKQLAAGKIDDRQMMPSARLVAPMLNDGGTQAVVNRVNEMIAIELREPWNRYKQSIDG